MPVSMGRVRTSKYIILAWKKKIAAVMLKSSHNPSVLSVVRFSTYRHARKGFKAAFKAF